MYHDIINIQNIMYIQYKNSQKYNKNNKFQINSKILHKIKKQDLTVILDLDNTLISSFIKQNNSDICDFFFTLPNDDQFYEIGVIKRPNVDKFLLALSKFAKIYLFTAAKKEYALEIINQIDPIGKYFSKIFTREDCCEDEQNKIKKNYLVCGTNMARTLIVDDIPENFKEYSGNGIPIIPFNGGINDDALSQVFQKIIYRSGFSDVRSG